MVQAKYPDILSDLRSRIASGALAPGSRLPTWSELASHYAVGRPTMMRVMAALKDEGFVTTDSTRGSFVAPQPPCRRRIALVFGSSPGQAEAGGWPRFWQSIQDAAAELASDEGWELALFHDLDTGRPCANARRLDQDLQEHRLAGVIAAPHGVLHSLPALVAERVPMVQIGGRWEGWPAAAVTFDWTDLRRRCARQLHELGARRIAILGTEGCDFETWAEALAGQGLGGESWWRFGAGIVHARPTANLVRLLFSQTQAPDGLLIADDNLILGATLGLLEAGVEVGRSVQVVAHCNWPFPVDAPLPVHHIGFDSRQLLREALRRLAQPGAHGDLLLPAVSASERAGAAVG